MYQTLLISSSLFILHVMATPQFHGRRMCGTDIHHSSVVTMTESFVQPVHKPYITLCQGHRLCSTYKTVYRVAYRQVTRAVPVSHSYPECCPGWRRLHSHNCNQAVCGQSCVNGGTCLRPNYCACPLGWMGRHCQTDVDECSEQQPCSHQCVNMAGSYRCVCREGYRLAGDAHSCENLPPSPAPPTRPSQTAANDHRPPSSDTGGRFGLTENVTEEVQSLKKRVELLEQKLQLVLAPFTSLFPMSLDEGVSEKTSFLSHSFQQLDRIDSLSEQIGFLEERLGTCSCQEN
ncbi:epidermal growth factor-like protein 7 [Coregonus clupeaformis]|uniref:epidermal growth factor-like protein 7 n=1 Tax=Coregonus clupeaformis TaxID=59861 RepID=UPI001E1C7067|nr:epidermal growth factor-like protein 7 [Coregonus clupeaformis]